MGYCRCDGGGGPFSFPSLPRGEQRTMCTGRAGMGDLAALPRAKILKCPSLQVLSKIWVSWKGKSVKRDKGDERGGGSV